MAILGADDIFGDEGDARRPRPRRPVAVHLPRSQLLTFNLTESDQQALSCSMDDETLRFIRRRSRCCRQEGSEHHLLGAIHSRYDRQASEVSNAHPGHPHMQKSYSAVAVTLSKWKSGGSSGGGGGAISGVRRLGRGWGQDRLENITHEWTL
uniref:Cyclic nucleotide-binding domain-containing protein n=1 Tax=Macrostomum lignano TaxID=282301 RepID=A0A1I8FEG6_9PLAT